MEPPPEIDPRHRLGLAGEAVAERHIRDAFRPDV